MASKDYPDPLADWFKRNRHWLALSAWLFSYTRQPSSLLRRNAHQLADQFYLHRRILRCSVLVLSSRLDRNGRGYWGRLLAAWEVVLLGELAIGVTSLVRDIWRPSWLITMGLTALFFLFAFIPYRWDQQRPVLAAHSKSGVSARMRSTYPV